MSRADRQEVISNRQRAGAERTWEAPATLAEEIDQLASRVDANSLSRVSPERFHVDRNDIVVSLRRIARRLRGPGERREATTTWRPDGR